MFLKMYICLTHFLYILTLVKVEIPLRHSLFIINIFITKLLENGTPQGVPFSCQRITYYINNLMINVKNILIIIILSVILKIERDEKGYRSDKEERK